MAGLSIAAGDCVSSLACGIKLILTPSLGAMFTR